MSASDSTQLVRKLEYIGTRARWLTRGLAHETSRHDHGVDPVEFKQHSEASAYFAFVSLGGDPEGYDHFEWEAKEELLLTVTVRNLREEMAGKHSSYRDYRARFRRRENRMVLDEFRWTQYDATGGAEAHETRGDARRSHNDWRTAPPPQEQELRDAELQQLPDALAAVLTPQETYLLVEHYVNDRPYKALAAEMVASDPKLRIDPKGQVKAMNRIAATLFRARLRAALRLDDRWNRLMQETV